MSGSETASSAQRRAPKPEGFGHGQLCAEHDRLGLRLQRIQAALRAGDLEATKSEFWRFCKAIESHMRLEETIVFPQFRQSGLVPDCELLEELIEEHGQIRAQLESIGTLLGRGGPASEPLERLGALLNAHEAKEELFLYPMLFHLADSDFVSKLFHSIHR
jgi:iron-sulfur cluster repair protein YtfE (RIC family)